MEVVEGEGQDGLLELSLLASRPLSITVYRRGPPRYLPGISNSVCPALNLPPLLFSPALFRPTSLCV